MPNLLIRGRRPAPARGQLLAVLTAAFVAFQQFVLLAPAASAQSLRVKAPGKIVVTKSPTAPGIRKAPAPTLSDPTPGPTISVITLGTPITQNFDTLIASGSATWTNDSTLTGWYHARTGTGTTIVAQNGSSNAGNLYSYGTGTATDRALGSLGSGNAAVGNLFWGIELTNNTGATITSLDVSYTGEQWRNSAAAAQTVAFSYLVGSPTVTGSLAEFQSAGVAVPQLDFTSPITGGTALQLDGNLAANRVTLTHSITGLNIPNGTEVMLRWSDPDHTGADHGLSIDDFSVTANGVGATPNISVNDAQLAEPASPNTADMTFTVSLSAAATGAVSVNFQTNDQTATAGTCGQPGADYVSSNGTVNFVTGEQVKTINVPICSDAVSDDNETFTVTLSSPSGGNITDGTATGTITANTAGTILISELRTSGPGGSNDDFVEIYNNSDTPHTVTATDISAGYGVFKMGTDCTATPVLIGTIPNGTVIPARGHYLMVGSAYSLTNYGGTGAAAGNLTFSSDLGDDNNVGVFSTDNVANISSTNRLDAVGFGVNVGGACNLLREPSNLGAVSGSTAEHTFFRKQCDFVGGVGCATPGNPKDTNDNSADFMFADTNGTFISGISQKLGAPGPENMASPIRRDTSGVGLLFLDNTKSSSAVPNRERDFTMDAPNNSTFGTLTIRRRVVNSTGGNVTRLRFRIIEMTTFPSPAGTADLRARTSTLVVVSGISDPSTCLASNGVATTPCTVNVQGTTLEEPPSQPNGGGMNSTLAAGTISTGTPLAPGASINVNFLLGIQQTGTFRFYIIVEALP